jgi:hypothetical protein
MFRQITTILVLIGWAAVAVAAGKVRTWTSTDGRTMEAEFVRELDGDVTFLKDGKLIVIRAEKLSEKDQQVIKDLSAGIERTEDSSNKPATSDGPPEESPDEATPKSGKAIAIKTRTWTDRFGARSSGKFIRVDGNNVIINRGTRVLTVPFDSLSDADQEYVREVLISQGKESEIPSETPTGGGAIGGGIGGGMPGGRNPGIGRGPGMPGMGPGAGIGGAMPPGAGRPGGIGAGRGPGMNAGMSPPPGMMPPAMGPGGAGAMPPGIAGGIGGPMGTGMPGANAPGTPGQDFSRDGFPRPAGGMATGSMPGMGTMPGTGAMPGMGAMPAPGAMAGMGSMPGAGGMPGSGGMGGSSMGSGPRMPSMERASIPSIPNIQFEEYFECSKCGAKLTKQETSGTSCPRCNATWGFKQDQFGNKTLTTAGRGQVSAGVAVAIVVVLLGMVVFIALFIGIIVAIVKATNSSGARPPYPQQFPQRRY